MSAYQVVCCLMTFRFDRVRYLILFRINISSKVFIFIILRSKICSNRQKDLDQSLYVKRATFIHLLYAWIYIFIYLGHVFPTNFSTTIYNTLFSPLAEIERVQYPGLNGMLFILYNLLD